MKRRIAAKLDIEDGCVELAHGSGGRAMTQLINEIFIDAFDNSQLNQQDDSAVLEQVNGRMAIATDSHVVSPLFFPGGDIGSLSVHGTVNDLAMSGAVPKYLTSGFILEEGFPLIELKRIVQSMAVAAKECGVTIVTGDTKVVEKGKGDGVFINTTGVGEIPATVDLSTDRICAGDKIIVSGTIGDHGMTILSARESLGFDSNLTSDSAPLHELVFVMLECAGDALRFMRDPTRGGLSAALNEVASQIENGMRIYESEIPIKEEVRAACEFLGFDALHVANEGKLIAICSKEIAEELLMAMRNHPMGRDAAIIGEVMADNNALVELETAYGGRRIVDWISGDQLPRIC